MVGEPLFTLSSFSHPFLLLTYYKREERLLLALCDGHSSPSIPLLPSPHICLWKDFEASSNIALYLGEAHWVNA